MSKIDAKTIGELERLSDAATPGPWNWVIQDHSMACLGVGDAMGSETTPHVLRVTPCKACADRADPKQWEWGRCLTPSKADADFIASARNALPTLLAAWRELQVCREALAKIVIETDDESARAVASMALHAGDSAVAMGRLEQMIGELRKACLEVDGGNGIHWRLKNGAWI